MTNGLPLGTPRECVLLQSRGRPINNNPSSLRSVLNSSKNESSSWSSKSFYLGGWWTGVCLRDDADARNIMHLGEAFPHYPVLAMAPVEEFATHFEWDDNSLEALLVALLGSCSLALDKGGPNE